MRGAVLRARYEERHGDVPMQRAPRKKVVTNGMKDGRVGRSADYLQSNGHFEARMQFYPVKRHRGARPAA
jgi:hypothetical protein